MKKIFCLLVLLFAAHSAFGVIAFVQSTECYTQTAGVEACSYTSSVAAGDFLVAAVSARFNSGTPAVTVSDNLNGAWTAASVGCTDSTDYTNLFYFQNSAAGTITITFTFGITPTAQYLLIGEYSGMATSSPQDGALVCGASSYGSNPNVAPAIATSNASDLILASPGNTGNPGASTVGSPYTARWSGSHVSPGLADQIVSSAGTYAGASFVPTYTGGEIPFTVAFKAAGSAPAATPTQISPFCIGP